MATGNAITFGHPSRRRAARGPQDEGLRLVLRGTLLRAYRMMRARLLLRPLEVSRVGWWLIAAGRHKVAVGADHVGFMPDLDLSVILGAKIFQPGRLRIGIAAVALVHRPGPRERMVDDRDLVVQQVRIGPVEMDALLEDGLIVVMKRQAGAVIGTGTLEGAARLDLEQAEAAGAVLVDPFADGVALIGRLHVLQVL